MYHIYDDLDGEVSASEVIKYWKDMYRKMACLNDELYTRIDGLEAELIEAKCCLVKRERYHKAKLKRIEALRDYIQTNGNRAVYCAAQQMAGSATAGFYKNLLKRLEKALKENDNE